MPKLAKAVLRLCLVVVITAFILEAILQLAFTLLPRDLTQRMPQFRERTGYQLRTDHGAREYPAGEAVDLQVTPLSGDLYRLTCLKTADVESFEPYRVTYVRDNHGFRNPEPWPDDLDLVIIGDSFVAAEAVSDPFWRGMAESMLVLGLPGSGTLEQTLLLEAFGLPRSPEVVVVAYFSGNDMTDNMDFANLRQRGITFADRTHQDRSPLEYLVTVHLVLFVLDMMIAAGEDCHYPQLAQTSPPLSVSFFDEMLPLLANDQESLRSSPKFQVTESALTEMAAELRERGIPMLLLYIPQKAELFWNTLDSDAKGHIVDALAERDDSITVDRMDKNLTAQRDLILNLASEYRIEFLDLTSVLQSAVESGSSPYFFADTHWNQRGHDIARQALRDRLN